MQELSHSMAFVSDESVWSASLSIVKQDLHTENIALEISETNQINQISRSSVAAILNIIPVQADK